MFEQASITSTIYWDTDNNSIRWSNVTHNMALITKIILEETKTMEITINRIMKILISMDFPESINISL